ncbi:hypothetical protein [Halomonas caseinilytica]|nr:hypothetical protein [Halomonas caseinilytica]
MTRSPPPRHIGVVWLEEPLRRERLLAGGLILAGVTLSHWG